MIGHSSLIGGMHVCICTCTKTNTFINSKGNVKLPLYLTKYHTMKMYEGVEVQLYTFLTSVLE